MMVAKVTGVNEVLANLKWWRADAAVQFSKGLRLAGLHLLYVSQKIYCPVQTGRLRDSGYVRHTGIGFNTSVFVGYTEPYGIYVHEDTDKRHGRAFNVAYADRIATARTKRQKRIWFRRGDTQQAKFLEKPAKEQRPEMLAIIKGQAQTITMRRRIQGKVY